MPRIQLSWLLVGSAAALRPQITRRNLCGAAPALVLAPPALLAPTASLAADGPSEALLPEAIYAGNDWIADRKLTIIEGDEQRLRGRIRCESRQRRARRKVAGAEGEAADSTRASPLPGCELRRAAIG